MTYNNEVFHKTSAEVNSQIASYFSIVDNSVQMSDTNKRYTINPQACYAPGCPVPAKSFTTVIISPNSDNTADLYNGFIKANLQFKFRINKGLDQDTGTVKVSADGATYKFDRIWFGFKDAMDAIEKYEILANGITIYTQNFAPEESFLTSLGNNELSKRADIYSKVRHKDVWSQNYGQKCGCVIRWNVGAAQQETSEYYNIPLKIDLRRFLPLSNIKYLPAFAGKIELRLYFGPAAMVYCPVGPDKALQHNIIDLSKLTIDNVTNEFTAIGDEIYMWTGGAITSSVWSRVTSSKRICDVTSDYRVSECYSVVPCFGIDNNIYQALVQKYMGQALTFPTQTISVYPMANQLSASNASSTQTITPRFVDSIFILFPLKANHHTVFKNPLFTSCQVRCGGYGSVPAIPFSTAGIMDDGKNYSDPSFIEYCENAMNLNGEQSGFNKEVVKSLINEKTYNNSTGNYSNDRTSFFIGLPTETDNTFQQGQTSNTPITYEIMVTQDIKPKQDGVTVYGTYGNDNRVPPKICMLLDSTFSIQVQGNGMPPICDLGCYDITSPVLNS